MRDAISGYSIFNANRMVRQQKDDRTVLIMESDADLAIVDGHIQEGRFRLAPGHGKIATAEAARLHQEAGDEWVVCFVDKDFSDASLLEDANLFCTSHYDLEAEAFFVCPEVVNRFIRTHRPSEKVIAPPDVTDRIVAMAVAVGVIRWIAMEECLEISLSKFPMGELTKEAHGQSYLDRALTVATGRAHLPEPGEQILRTRSDALLSDLIEPHIYCNGHDLLGAACAVLSSLGGVRPRPSELSAAFRAAIGCECFVRLSVHQKLLAWSSQMGLPGPWDCDRSVA